MESDSSKAVSKFDENPRPIRGGGDNKSVRLRRAYLGTGIVGILTLGWGIGEILFQLPVEPVPENFLLGFGIVLVLGSIMFRLAARPPRGQ
jgi:hypothetical protein